MKTVINSIVKTFSIAILAAIILSLMPRADQNVMACEEAPVSFDLSVIEQWCGGEHRGSIRFVGAELYRRDGDKLVLLDEQGQYWVVSGIEVEDNDFLLLWIEDNDTDSFEDDTVMKVWREAH